jgi:hypothetical protein
MADGFGIGSARKPEVSGLERVGLALSNLGAGLAGQPFPSIPYMAEKRKARLQTIQELSGGFSLITAAKKISQMSSPEERHGLNETLVGHVENAMPGWGDATRALLEGNYDLPGTVMELIKHDALTESIYQREGLPGVQKYLSDSKNLDRVQASYDLSFLPEDREKLARALAELEKNNPKLLSKHRKEGGLTVGDVAEMNPTLTGPADAEDATMLSESMIGRMARNAGAYNLLSEQESEKVRAAGMKVKEAGPEALVTLKSPTGEFRSFRKGSPQIDSLIAQGWIEDKPKAPRALAGPITLLGPKVKGQKQEVRSFMSREDPEAKALVEQGWTIVPHGRTAAEAAGTVPSPAFISKMQQKRYSTAVTLGTVNDIIADFEDKFATIPHRFRLYTTQTIERMGLKITDEEKAQLDAFANFQSEMAAVVNERIRDITGAAVSAQEAERLMKELADAAKDSPTMFRAKINRIQRTLKIGLGRLNWMLSSNMQFESPSQWMQLADFEGMLSDMTRDAMQTIISANPEMDEAAAFDRAEEEMKEMFGLTLSEIQ